MEFESFSKPEEWDLLNFRLKKELGSTHQLRSYINPYLAAHDLLISLAQLYAHKRSVAWVTGVSPLLENSQPHFVRESYQIQSLKMDELLAAPDQGQSAIEKLNKDTLFFVFFKNHALSGESYDYKKLEEWANAKKIIFVLISHVFVSDFNLGPTSMGLQVVAPDLTLTVLPERSKLLASIGPYQNLQWQDRWLSAIKGPNSGFEAQVKSFENSFQQAIWKYSGSRNWNNSVLVFDSVHGHRVAEKLKEKGFPNVRSYADCVSKSPKSIRKWIQPEMSDETLRGLIVLSFRDPKDIPSAALIEQIIQEIKAESQWTF